ncbi:MAG: hypothetical protein KAT47_00575 [Candidatus Aegiribacteria sp.]|nr:hypothetical protein [Candidatus Aegiribacteria sp.]
MRYLFLITAVLFLIIGCSRDTTRLIDQEEMDEMRNELDISRCESRMDSLRFEIEGMLYHVSLTADGYTSLEELLPDSIPGCPVSKQPYIIDETDSGFTITCPIGHGSVYILK